MPSLEDIPTAQRWLGLQGMGLRACLCCVVCWPPSALGQSPEHLHAMIEVVPDVLDSLGVFHKSWDISPWRDRYCKGRLSLRQSMPLLSYSPMRKLMAYT